MNALPFPQSTENTGPLEETQAPESMKPILPKLGVTAFDSCLTVNYQKLKQPMSGEESPLGEPGIAL